MVNRHQDVEGYTGFPTHRHANSNSSGNQGAKIRSKDIQRTMDFGYTIRSLLNLFNLSHGRNLLSISICVLTNDQARNKSSFVECVTFTCDGDPGGEKVWECGKKLAIDMLTWDDMLDLISRQ